jgi:hypothetical protein
MEREALKLALEALEEAQTNDDGMEKWDRKSKAITAIKAALAQPAPLRATPLHGVKPPRERVEKYCYGDERYYANE